MHEYKIQIEEAAVGPLWEVTVTRHGEEIFRTRSYDLADAIARTNRPIFMAEQEER